MTHCRVVSERLAAVFSFALAGTIVLTVGGYVLVLADRVLETAFWPAGTGVYLLGLAAGAAGTCLEWGNSPLVAGGRHRTVFGVAA